MQPQSPFFAKRLDLIFPNPILCAAGGSTLLGLTLICTPASSPGEPSQHHQFGQRGFISEAVFLLVFSRSFCLTCFQEITDFGSLHPWIFWPIPPAIMTFATQKRSLFVVLFLLIH